MKSKLTKAQENLIHKIYQDGKHCVIDNYALYIDMLEKILSRQKKEIIKELVKLPKPTIPVYGFPKCIVLDQAIKLINNYEK